VAEDKTPPARSERGVMTRMLATVGLFAAGFFAANVLRTPRHHIRGWVDRVLRRLVFQSKRETIRTEERSAASLIAELSASVYRRFLLHNVFSVAAGSAYFIVLAIFPGLAALVAFYGFLGDPADIGSFIKTMPDFIPTTVTHLVEDYLSQLIARPRANLGTFLFSLGIALWSANSGMKSLVEALNVVYERREKRSFFKVNLLATVMTMSFMLFMIVSVNIMIIPVWDWLRRAFGDSFLSLRWLVLLFAVQILISMLYYFAPCGRQRRWQFLTAGATLTSLLWVAMSMVFSAYLTTFANYSVTYGSLGAAAIFMTWIWLTVTTLLAGAEVDAAVEHLGSRAEASD
jgi:membrane protein